MFLIAYIIHDVGTAVQSLFNTAQATVFFHVLIYNSRYEFIRLFVHFDQTCK